MKRKKAVITEYESVKIKKSIVERVRANKEATGVPVSVFFERAAEEKLSDELPHMVVRSSYHSSMGDLLMKENVKKKK